MTLHGMTREGEGYQDTDGTWYASLVELIHAGRLGFCLCGDVEANLRYVRDGLRHIARVTQEYAPGTDFVDWYRTWHPGWVADGLVLFGQAQARDFFFYWADAQGFTEHGTRLPGWLTPEGAELLQTLDDVLGVP